MEGINVFSEVYWTPCSKNQLKVIGCDISLYDVGKALDKYLVVPSWGALHVKEFIKAHRGEMQTVWEREDIASAEEACAWLDAMHRERIMWRIQLIRDYHSPTHLVRLGQITGEFMEEIGIGTSYMSDKEKQCAATLQRVFAEVVNSVVCRHYPDLLKEQIKNILV